jgi:hypothetical protein
LQRGAVARQDSDADVPVRLGYLALSRVLGIVTFFIKEKSKGDKNVPANLNHPQFLAEAPYGIAIRKASGKQNPQR